MEEQDSPRQELLAEIRRLRLRVDELEHDSARLEAVLANLTSIVAVGDSEGRFTYVSPQVRSVLGYEPEEIVGELYFDWLHPNDLPKFMEAVGTTFEGTPLFDVESRIRHKAGHYVHISAAGRIVDDSGEKQIVGVLTDITRRVQADERLRRLSSALQQCSDAVVICDLNGVVVEANRSAMELFDAEKDGDLIGRSSFDFVTADDAEKALRDLTTLLEVGQLNGVETRFTDQTGKEVLLDLSVAVLTDEAGTQCGIVGVLRDLTKQRGIEDELLKARKLESIGLLAGGIAHDFNNVLSAILGNLNVARARCDSDNNVHPLLVDAEKATLRARKLTQRLLTFARGGEPIKSTASIANMLAEATENALPRDAPRPTVELADKVWAADVDPGQVRQAFEHLLRSAYAAGDPDVPIIVRAQNVRIPIGDGALLPGSYVKVAIEDHGPTIPPEQRADVFDPYFGTKNSDSALALATAFSIASRHGGTITVESAPDSGSIFAIHLPASLSPTQEHALLRTKIAGEGRRILVMDDELILRRVVHRMLDSLGFEVTLVADGEAAIERYEQARADGTPFHAVMLDLTVPDGLGGRDTMERLRALDPDVRAIVASGYSDDAVMANFTEYGFRAVLAKPFQIAELAAALHRTL